MSWNKKVFIIIFLLQKYIFKTISKASKRNSAMFNSFYRCALTLVVFQLFIGAFSHVVPPTRAQMGMSSPMRVDQILNSLGKGIRGKIATNNADKITEFERWLIKNLLKGQIEDKISSDNQVDFWYSRQG